MDPNSGRLVQLTPEQLRFMKAAMEDRPDNLVGLVEVPGRRLGKAARLALRGRKETTINLRARGPLQDWAADERAKRAKAVAKRKKAKRKVKMVKESRRRNRT